METEFKPLRDPMIWIDCEMTGLDTKRFSIIEIAVIVTDGQNLDHRILGPELVIKCPDEELAQMDAWCTKTHTESGLVDKVKNSQLTLKDAET
jgi:oligoribonuclease